MVNIKSDNIKSDKYLYFGVGIISIVLIIGAIGLFQTIPSPQAETAKITIQLNENNYSKEYAFYTTQEKLFSEDPQTINFSPVEIGTGISSDSINCNMNCEKREWK